MIGDYYEIFELSIKFGLIVFSTSQVCLWFVAAMVRTYNNTFY